MRGGRGRKEQAKIPPSCVCVRQRHRERQRGRYIVRIQLHGYRAHGVFRDSPGAALTHCIGCNVQVK